MDPAPSNHTRLETCTPTSSSISSILPDVAIRLYLRPYSLRRPNRRHLSRHGSEIWIDVSHATDKSTGAHWISESNILDLFFMPGPAPADTFAQYSGLTGTSVLPPHWSLGYHYYRWNYISSDDVRTAQKRFDEEDMPVDVFWLGIEYADEHKYFMWDQKNFPDPVGMTNDVAANGRKMVIIIDPHLKRT
ncbi:glycosyl hydrolases family 31-domain-containing protein [Mycena capillaripes]|nr:glycosyl hydrolases family 31-domain-containing protein [Mycena capillaripes]